MTGESRNDAGGVVGGRTGGREKWQERVSDWWRRYVSGHHSAVNPSDCLRQNPLVCQCGDWRSQGENCLFPSFLRRQES